MTTKSFTYLRHKFTPLGTLPASSTFHSVTRQCQRIGKGINNYDEGRWSHDEFYKRAKKAGCEPTTDVFEMDEQTTVLPCKNELFEYIGRYDSHQEAK